MNIGVSTLASSYGSNNLTTTLSHNSFSGTNSLGADISNLETITFKGKTFEVEKLFKILEKTEELIKIHYPEVLL